MDNKPDNNSSDKPVDGAFDEQQAVPDYDVEPSTGGITTSTTETAAEVSSDNPVPASSPFGPPIENMGTQPGFGIKDEAVKPTFVPVTPVESPVPKPINDVITPVATTDSSTLNSIAPDPSPVPAPIDENAISERDGKKTVIKLPKQKKSMKGLMIGLIVLLLLVAVAVGGYFFVKNGADSAADSYTTKVKTYLGQVNAAMSYTSVDDPNTIDTIKTDVTKVSKPVLEKPLLSDVDFISQKHADAVTLNSQLNSHINTLTRTLTDLSSVRTFGIAYNVLSTQATTTTSKVTSDSSKADTLTMFNDYSVILDKMKSLVADTTLPVDLDSAQADLTKAIDAEITALKDEIAKLTADDTAGYNTAKAAFASAANDEMNAFGLIQTYVDTIPAKLQAATDMIKNYADSVK